MNLAEMRVIISQRLVDHPFVVGVVFSLLLSTLLTSLNPLFNNDGVLYLRAAEAFSSKGIDAAVQLYPRPFYSVLIGFVHQLTGLDFILSAHLLNTVLLAGLVCSFTMVAGEFSEKKRIYLLAVLTLITFAGLNQYRHYIIRDFGYWTFSLAAIGCFLKHYRNLNWLFFAGWISCTALATLFRPEAVVLFLLPLCRLLDYRLPERCLMIYYRQVITVAIFVLALMWIVGGALSVNLYQELFNAVSSELEFFGHVQGGRFAEATKLFGEQVLNRFSDEYARPALAAGLGYIFFAKFFNLLGAVNLTVLLCAVIIARRSRLVPRAIIVPYVFAITLVAIPVFMFLANRQFLQGRYIMLIALLCLFLVPPFLDLLYTRFWNKNIKGWQKIGGVTLLLYLFLDSLVSFGYSKHYMLEGISWMQSNIASDSSVYSNSGQLIYMTKLNTQWPESMSFQSTGMANPGRDYNIWAVKLNKNDEQLRAYLQQRTPPLVELASFFNKRGDQLAVYESQVLVSK